MQVMNTEINYREEAEAIRTRRPREASFCPAPLPYVGEIKLRRRRDGGYLIASLACDGQAGQFLDGTLAADVFSAADLTSTGDEDLLAQALERAHQTLNDLRLEEALKMVALLRRERSDEDLVIQLREVLAEMTTMRR